MLALFVSAGTAFYELSPSRNRLIDLDALMASRGMDRTKYVTGPSLDDVIRALGDDPEKLIKPDDDPELRPYFGKY